MYSPKVKTAGFFVLAFTALCSCNLLKTAGFDQYSYQCTSELLVEAEQLINQATTSFTTHREQSEILLPDVRKVVAYEKMAQIMKSLLKCGT